MCFIKVLQDKLVCMCAIQVLLQLPTGETEKLSLFCDVHFSQKIVLLL